LWFPFFKERTMRFGVVGADKETGNDVEVVLTAATQAEAEELAHNRGILVSGIKRVADPDADAIALIDDDPDDKPGTVTGVALADGSVAGASRAPEAKAAKSAAGLITVNASAPSDTAHTGAGAIPGSNGHAGTAMEYHILMNQSLYLLETAVNKHLKDGWEPAGGLGIGISNNAQVFYQAVTRRKK
jgi:hypothetical protein